MALYDLKSTTSSRSKNTANFLAETATEKARLLEEAKQEETERLYNGTFIKNLRPRKSMATIAQKEMEISQATKNATAFVVTRLVTEAMPLNLSHIQEKELTEQICMVKDTVFDGIINESSLKPVFSSTKSGIKGKDISATSVTDYLNTNASVDGNDPTILLKKIVGLNALERFKSGENTVNGSLYNAIISKTDSADLPSSSDDHAKLSGILKDINSKLITVYSKQIQNKVANSFNQDAEEAIVNETKYEGLAESIVSIRKRRERKAAVRHSVSKELFKNTSILQEAYGATGEDYLNEAFFQMCVLEAYRMLDCVKLNDEEITLHLKKQRIKFAK